MSTATARDPSVSPDSSPMAASVCAGFLTTPAPRTRPAGHSHSTSRAPPVWGLFIKGRRSGLCSLPCGILSGVGLPVGTERGQGESGARVATVHHVCSPCASGEWLEITRSSPLPRPDSPAQQISSNNPGSLEWILPPTCHLSPSNVVTALFPELVPVLLLSGLQLPSMFLVLAPCWREDLMIRGTTDKVLGVPSLPTSTLNTHTHNHTLINHIYTYSHSD